jgi:hypothetical protein
MCIPHATNTKVSLGKGKRTHLPKKSVPFNKKLLEPDPDFIDERKQMNLLEEKTESFWHKIFSFNL